MFCDILSADWAEKELVGNVGGQVQRDPARQGGGGAGQADRPEIEGQSEGRAPTRLNQQGVRVQK